MDVRVRRAATHHLESTIATELATEYKRLRDELIREVWAEELARRAAGEARVWTYEKLAAELDTEAKCSPELIAKIVKTQEKP